MSLRLDVLRSARLARNLLREAADRVVEFLRCEFNPDGGARDRAGQSDLYYTVFALDGLDALGAELPREQVTGFLQRFDDGAELDLVHLACLARCWSAVRVQSGLALPVARQEPRPPVDGLLARIEAHRCADGGFAPAKGAEFGTAYHAFLAAGAFQDLDRPIPDPDRLAESIVQCRSADGGFANERGMDAGATSTTAAAVALLRELRRDIPDGIGDWLMAQSHPRGGFRAGPQSPLPDLLSTATALHALAMLGVSIDKIREPCLDFVDSLWTGRAFCGHWADNAEDCEYTFYALLALGHLSP